MKRSDALALISAPVCFAGWASGSLAVCFTGLALAVTAMGLAVHGWCRG